MCSFGCAGKNKLKRNWSLALPVAFGLCALNWLAPEFFSLGIVYLHPLVALWFLDRHLARTRPDWLRTYRRCLCLLPLLLVGMFWQLSRTAALPDDKSDSSGGLRNMPALNYCLTSPATRWSPLTVFLEMLHYGVWLVALPLLAPLAKTRRREAIWRVKTVPVARHPRGFPKLVATALALGLFLVLILWFGFSVDYATTRDVYFTVAIAQRSGGSNLSC